MVGMKNILLSVCRKTVRGKGLKKMEPPDNQKPATRNLQVARRQTLQEVCRCDGDPGNYWWLKWRHVPHSLGLFHYKYRRLNCVLRDLSTIHMDAAEVMMNATRVSPQETWWCETRFIPFLDSLECSGGVGHR